MRPAALLALALLTLSACSGGLRIEDEPEAEIPDAYPNHTADQIRAAVAASIAPVRFFSADGRIEIEAPRLDQSATYSIRSRLADSTTVVVRGPFGIEGGRGLVTPREFVGYDKLNGKLYVGSVSAAERYVPGAGSSEALARALSGLVAPEAGAWTVVPDSGRYGLVQRRPDGSRRILIVDPALWRVVRAQEVDPSNVVIADQAFSAFDTVDGVVMPRRVVLRAPQERIRLTMEHRRLAPNPSDFRLRFNRPTDVETVRLD